MSSRRSLLTLIFLLASLELLFAELKKNGANVCTVNRERSDYNERKVNCNRERYTSLILNCLSSLETERNEEVYQCCKGYVEKEGKCEPHCPDCVHGTCLHPKECGDCFPNFGGINCNETCPFGKFGLQCDKDCSCITDPKCNLNYTYCSCGLGDIPEACKDICRCRSNCPHPGYHGKNCSVPCPTGSFGRLCMEKCWCNLNNTLECNKETGDCKCKPKFHGLTCEHECTGILECLNSSNVNCTCKPSLDQKIDALNKTKIHIERRLNETRDEFEKRLHDVKGGHLKITLICFMILTLLVLCLSYFVFKYKMTTKKLKKDLKIISIRYSNGTPSSDVDNPLYKHTLSPSLNGMMSSDSKKTRADPFVSLDTKKRFVDDWSKNNLFEKINAFTQNLLKHKSVNDPQLDEDQTRLRTDSEIYSSIDEFKNAIKTNEDDRIEIEPDKKSDQ